MLHINGLLTSHLPSEEVALYPVMREETSSTRLPLWPKVGDEARTSHQGFLTLNPQLSRLHLCVNGRLCEELALASCFQGFVPEQPLLAFHGIRQRLVPFCSALLW